jgi:hypothetical protein
MGLTSQKMRQRGKKPGRVFGNELGGDAIMARLWRAATAEQKEDVKKSSGEPFCLTPIA